MQTISPIIMGTLVSILILIIVLPLIIKYRTRKIVSVKMKFIDAVKLSIIPVVIFVIVYQTFNNIDIFIWWIPNWLWIIGLFVWIAIMEIILMRKLIKESLDSVRAKKLAKSSTYYFFWFIICLWIAITLLREYM